MISVFGGTGFIGSSFVKSYTEDCHIISREDRSPVSDDILYLISTTDNYNVFSNPMKDIDVNLKVLCEVLWKAKDNKNTVFNFISSWFVYGDCELPAKENSHCSPQGMYSITKKCAEDIVKSFCIAHNIKYRIIRLCNVYGKGDLGASKKKNALQYLIGELADNKDINLYHGGDFLRDYLHVSDVCSAIKIIMDRADTNTTINVGSGEKYVFKNLITTAKHYLSSKAKVASIEPTEFHKAVQVKDMYLDVSKLKELGFSPKVSIKKGLFDLCQT